MSHPLAACALPLTLIDPPPEPLLAPLAEARLGEHSAGLDLILEGFLLHHGTARMASAENRDTRLLAGDYCYADGLANVAGAGDIGAVQALARLIAVGSGLVADRRNPELVALWHATARAIGADEAQRAELHRAIDALTEGSAAEIHALADPTSTTYATLTEALA